MFILRKHGKTEHTFFPLLLWQLLSWASSGFRFTECSGQESSSDFMNKSRESISVSCSHRKFEKRTCSVYNGIMWEILSLWKL
jgi:hypothetical protein